MLEDIIALKTKFEDIKKLGWIESMRKGTTGIGYTFETLLGKSEESFPIPDFGEIEIKTQHINSKECTTLFNANPDGDYLFPIKNLHEKYGFPDKKNPNYKVFFAAVYSYANYAGKNYRFRLHIDKKRELIRLIAIDRAGNMIDTKTTWSFKMLKEKLNCKLKYLAIVKANSRYKNEKFYYKYEKINFYKLKGFDTFLQLIEEGIIRITFKVSVYRNGLKAGLYDNHGTGFDINKDKIETLFTKIY